MRGAQDAQEADSPPTCSHTLPVLVHSHFSLAPGVVAVALKLQVHSADIRLLRRGSNGLE
jgi:hypothetical protein